MAISGMSRTLALRSADSPVTISVVLEELIEESGSPGYLLLPREDNTRDSFQSRCDISHLARVAPAFRRAYSWGQVARLKAGVTKSRKTLVAKRVSLAACFFGRQGICNEAN